MQLKSLPKIYQLGVQFPKKVILISLFVSLLSFWAAQKLDLISNLTSLLPKNTDSVQNLEKVKKYFGGSGFLILTVEAESESLAQKFADQFVIQLEHHPQIRHVDYRQPVDFFKQRQWLYLSLEDLQEVEERIRRSLKLQERGISPVFSSLVDFADEEDRPNLDFEDIFRKYKKRIGFQSEDYLTDEQGRFVVLKIEARNTSEDINFSRNLIRDIRQIENDLKREDQFNSIHVGYTGSHQASIEETDLLKSEISQVSVIVTVALLLILLIYFKRWSAPFLIGIPITLGILWTGGIVYLLLGHLNLITGFAAAILAGLGSDYGIYLLTRYYHEREIGTPFHQAINFAFANTGRATYASMITTVGAFIALLFSDFGVFVELGLIGAIGLWMNYLAMMLILPSFLSLLEKYKLQKASSKNWKFLSLWRLIVQIFSVFLSPKNSFAAVILILFICGISLFSLSSQTKIHFESGQLDTESLPSSRLWKRVDKIVQSSLNPTLILARGQEEENKIVRRLERLLEEKKPSELIFNNVVGLSSFIPENQTEKKALLSKTLKEANQLKILLKKKKEQLTETLGESVESSSIFLENLPIEIKRRFVSPQNENIFGIYLFPSFGRINLESIQKYYEGIESLKKTIGINFIAADSSFIAYDLIELIKKEASQIFMLILLFFLGVLSYAMRSFKKASIIFLNLMGSLLILSGVLWLAGIRLNILNIAVIPIILGTGIDCFVHFSHRYEECGEMLETLRTEIPAMFISSLTSIIGFAGLLFTSSAGLRSIGWVAVFGLTIVTFFCALVFPRCLLLSSFRRTPEIVAQESDIQVQEEAV